MRLYEVLTESTQLDEGPKWDAVKRAGTAAAGAVGRGAAAVGKSAVRAAPGVGRAIGKGAAALGKGALKAAPAVGQAIGSTIGAAAGGLAGSAVNSFKSTKNAGTATPADATASNATTGSTAPDATVSPANIPKMNLVQMQQAILAMKPGDRAKLLQFLQSQQPVAKTPVRQAPGATGVKVAGKAPAVRARRSTV
jgi:hypothetical protein